MSKHGAMETSNRQATRLASHDTYPISVSGGSAWERYLKVWDSQASEANMSPPPNETACRRFSHPMNER